MSSEGKYLVIEQTGNGIKELDVVGRYKTPREAYICRDVFKKENPVCIYRVFAEITV